MNWFDLSSTLGAAALADCRRVGAYEVCCPVCLPLAVVIGECLLPTGMIAVELVPLVADLHGTAVALVLAVELTVVAVEASNHRHIHLPAGATDPIDRPLPLF